MTPTTLGLVSFGGLLLLIALRIPIGLAMLASGFAGSVALHGSTDVVLAQAKHLLYGTFSNHALSIVPLFLLMGQFATIGGLSRALFHAAEACLGHRRGGLAMAAIGACTGFGAVCGSSLATAATMGQVTLPELRRAGYDPALATGTLAAGGTLGILVPPSIILVIYAILTEQNIAKLFVAAIVPGLIAALGYLLCIAVVVRARPGSAGRPQARLPWRERLPALVATWPVLAIFALVVGGIYAGVFTPTEAAAIGAASTAFAALANGTLDRGRFVEALLGTAAATGMIFLIVLGAALYNAFLGATQLPQAMALFVADADVAPLVVLALVLVFYLVFGCVMDSLSMILLTIPVFYPVLAGLDFGLSGDEFALWLGVLVLMAVEIGLITPPVGMNLFVINRLADDVPIGTTFRGALPFVATDVMRVALLVAVPGLTLGLVRWLY